MSKLGQKLFVAVSVGFTFSWGQNALAASADNEAVQRVVSDVEIDANNPLNFGVGLPNSGSKTIAPSDESAAATFNIRGEPGLTYVIGLPTNGSVKMLLNGGGTSDTEIDVLDFKSIPDGSGQLVAGDNKLSVGATRAALRPTQEVGNYTGTFTVTVTYQ